jgi:hypothetical protein
MQTVDLPGYLVFVRMLCKQVIYLSGYRFQLTDTCIHTYTLKKLMVLKKNLCLHLKKADGLKNDGQ